MPVPEVIHPDWALPANIKACVTTRKGGFSQGDYASLNLGDHVKDDPGTVARNRQLLRDHLGLPSAPLWLQQTHSTICINAAQSKTGCEADAAWTNQPGVVCTVMTADCLPVFFAHPSEGKIAIAHAGWRGLAQGVLENTLKSMDCPADQVTVWLGPAIGAKVFEVGDEVREAFVSQLDQAEAAFKRNNRGRWLADIYLLARQRLQQQGVQSLSGGQFCTYSESDRFFSYRRHAVTGRMASLIWMDNQQT